MKALVRAALALSSAALASLPLSLGTPAGAGGGSAVTARGAGPFADLAVTVSQTRDLVNQVVEVSWTGGAQTQPTSTTFGIDYLQVMQCWGDDPAGPRREQCQYGGRLGDGRGGGQTATRQVSYGSALVDPLETYRPPAGSFANVFVPFQSVTGKTTTGGRSEFFDASTTNEIPYARTRADGGGVELFEVQTGREAPGLGCGEPVAGRDARGCWLVVVPRGDAEVDGSVRSGYGASKLDSSPLSASNWEHRIVVPLSFVRVGSACPLGSERRLVGHEQVVEAVSRWQPKLCVGGGTTYALAQVSDGLARQQLLGPDPGMSVLTRPVPPAEVPADRELVYAPVALSGVAIGFLVERQAGGLEPPPEVLAREGTRVTDLRLTPRLVAKLLTQSYRNAVPDGDPAVAANPQVLSADPDFLALNPEFRELVYTTLSDVLVPGAPSDVTALLWEWVGADREARAFLDGKPDPWGMRVNPAYRGLATPLDAFPKSDPFCARYVDGRQPLCALERRGYASDMHEASRAAARGDNLSRESWDPLATPPAWKRSEPQPNGSRAILAVTDTATARRYGLLAARLRNAAGAFVAPTETSMSAAVAAMTPDADPAVRLADVRSKAAGAYPLTVVSYAATAPARLDREAAGEYAGFVEYAAGAGQVPGVEIGTLPDGYVPLPASLRTQARVAAAAIRARRPVAAPSRSPVVSTTSASPVDPVPGEPGAAPPARAPIRPAAAGPSVPVSVPPTPVVAPAPPVLAVTPAGLPVGVLAHYAVVGALVLGIVAGGGGAGFLVAGRPAGPAFLRRRRVPGSHRERAVPS